MANIQHIQRLPSGSPRRARFTVGRDNRGRWIVQDRQGRVGGLFVNEAAALHFAAAECNHDPAEICRAPDDTVLDFAPSSDPRLNLH